MFFTEKYRVFPAFFIGFQGEKPGIFQLDEAEKQLPPEQKITTLRNLW